MKLFFYLIFTILSSIIYLNSPLARFGSKTYKCGYEESKRTKFAEKLIYKGKPITNVKIREINLLSNTKPCMKMCDLTNKNCPDINIVNPSNNNPEYSAYVIKENNFEKSQQDTPSYVHNTIEINSIAGVIKCPGPKMFKDNQNIEWIPNPIANHRQLKYDDDRLTYMIIAPDHRNEFRVSCGKIKQIPNNSKYDITWNYNIVVTNKPYKYGPDISTNYKGSISCSDSNKNTDDYSLIFAAVPQDKWNGPINDRKSRVRQINKNDKIYPDEIIFIYQKITQQKHEPISFEPLCVRKVIDSTGSGNKGFNNGDKNNWNSNKGGSNNWRSNNWRSNKGDSNTGDSNNWRSNKGDSNTGDSNNWRSNKGDSNTGDSNNWRSNNGDSNRENSNNWRSNNRNGNSVVAGQVVVVVLTVDIVVVVVLIVHVVVVSVVSMVVVSKNKGLVAVGMAVVVFSTTSILFVFVVSIKTVVFLIF